MDIDRISRPEDQIYKASDVKELCGLTYRQLNDWDTKRSLLPENEDRGEGWRKYTLHEVFIISILAELKRKFFTATKKLLFVKERLSSKGDGHMNAMMVHVTLVGVSQWLITDFEDSLEMVSELEISDKLNQGFFHSEDQVGFVMLNITPIIQRMASFLTEKETPLSHDYISSLQEIKEKNDRSLELISGKDITKVEILMKDDTRKTVKVTSKRDVNSIRDELLKEHAFQKISYLAEDEKVVYVEQTVIYKDN